MSKAKTSVKTTLKLGSVEVPVGLIKVLESKKAKEPEFVTAGPHGGALKMEVRWSDGTPPGAELLSADSPSAVDPFGFDEPPAEGNGEVGPVPTRSIPVEVLVEEGYGPTEEVRRGVRRVNGEFIDLTEQLAHVEAMTSAEAMTVLGFIDSRAVPRQRLIGSYWLAVETPAGRKVLRMMEMVMRARRRVAVVRFVKRTRQSVGVIVPHDGALLLLELEFADAERKPDERSDLSDVAVTVEETLAMDRLVEAMSARPNILHDVVDEAVRMRRDLFDEASWAGTVQDPAGEDIPLDLVALSEVEKALAE